MNAARMSIALALILGLSSCSEEASCQPSPPEIDTATQLFKSGKFAEASKRYALKASENPQDYIATLQLARIAILSNRLDDAQKLLTKAIALRPDDDEAKVMLAAVFYRRDAFQEAAASLNGVDVSTNKLLTSQYPTLNIALLESFKDQKPYELHGSGQSTRLPFVKTDPLPVVSVRVNGGDDVTFFIDTGASEVTLDKDFARELGLKPFGVVQGTFSGGQHGEVQLGRIESLSLGDWTIKNLPVSTLALRQLSQDLGVKRIDGIIGTTLFYHFLATLDYPKGELVLRRKSAESREQLAASSSGKMVAIPFWIAGDHFMVAWGRVENLSPTLLFIDTGLTGAGVKLAESVIKEAGIKLEENKAYQGAGGGGSLRIVPYTVRHLSLGKIQQKNVAGLYDGPFPWQNKFGFRLPGMVGHDFFKPYAVTFDFQAMQLLLQQKPPSNVVRAWP